MREPLQSNFNADLAEIKRKFEDEPFTATAGYMHYNPLEPDADTLAAK